VIYLNNPLTTPSGIIISMDNNNTFVDKLYELIDNYNKRLNWDEYFISIALLMSSRSSCERLHVGCILVKDNRILSCGYNGFLKKSPHISRVKDNHEQGTIHAEINSVAHCANTGISSNNATCYVTHYPCINCFKCLVSAGISQIIYLKDYHNDLLVQELALESGIKIQRYHNSFSVTNISEL